MFTIDFSGDSTSSALAGCSVRAIGDSAVVMIAFHLLPLSLIYLLYYILLIYL